MDRISEAFASAVVLDAEARRWTLRELWSERTAVLLFLRHFG